MFCVDGIPLSARVGINTFNINQKKYEFKTFILI